MQSFWLSRHDVGVEMQMAYLQAMQDHLPLVAHLTGAGEFKAIASPQDQAAIIVSDGPYTP